MANKQGKMAGYINYRMRITPQDSTHLLGDRCDWADVLFAYPNVPDRFTR